MSNTTVDMTLHYRDIKIAFNGSVVNCVDVQGNPTEPFILDGSVYIPVRAAVNALGLDIDWNDSTNTVSITGAASGTGGGSGNSGNSGTGDSGNSGSSGTGGSETGGTEYMTVQDFLSAITDEQCYQIVSRAQTYLSTQATPSWASSLLATAIDDDITDGIVDNITDGQRMNMLAPRYEAAIMALRAKQQALTSLTDAQCYDIVRRGQTWAPDV